MLQLMIHAHVEFKTGDSSYARLGVEIFGLLPGEIFFFLTTTSTFKSTDLCTFLCPIIYQNLLSLASRNTIFQKSV